MVEGVWAGADYPEGAEVPAPRTERRRRLHQPRPTRRESLSLACLPHCLQNHLVCLFTAGAYALQSNGMSRSLPNRSPLNPDTQAISSRRTEGGRPSMSSFLLRVTAIPGGPLPLRLSKTACSTGMVHHHGRHFTDSPRMDLSRLAAALLLGLRHGVDGDHIAVITDITAARTSR